jgi:Protein of unknown function (DUF1641)
MIAKPDVLEPRAVADTGVAEWSPAGEAAVAELRTLLVEQRRVLARQAEMIEALDRRREEVEELIEISMPIANSAMRMGIERLGALESAGTMDRARHAVSAVRGAIAAKPPTLWQLWRRLRTPESRRGLAALAEVVHAVGDTVRKDGRDRNQDQQQERHSPYT